MLRVKQHLGQDTRNTSSDTLKTSYRRWEKSGHVPAKTAEAIALVLNVTVTVLQGQAPEAAPSRLDAITERIQQRLGEGHQALQEILDAEAAAERRTLHIAMDGNTPFQQDANATHQQNLRFIAERLTRRLEYAQLSQDKGELDEISCLLGFGQHEIQQPVSEDGLWLLLQDGAAADQPRFFHSVNDLTASAKDTIQQYLQSAPCDSRVTFRQEGAWFRLQVFNPHWKEDSAIQVRLSFVRGQASETGLQWTQPSWLDEISLRDFQHSLWTYSNYVEDLDSHENGPYSLGDLKLAIYRRPSREEFEKDGWGVQDKLISIGETWLKQTEIREKASADLTEVEIEDYLEDLENMLMRHAEYGNAHDVVTQRLCSHLLECMQPLLAEWPLKYWQFKAHQNCIAVELNAPLSLAQQQQKSDFYGTKYRIYLVVQAPQQEAARPVPWRSESIERAVDRIQRDFEAALAPSEIGPPLSHHLNIRQ